MNPMPIIFAGLMMLNIITTNLVITDYHYKAKARAEEDRLQVVVNYAADAAVKEMKETSANLGQDYASLSKLNIDPAVGLETFGTFLCKNYDIPVSTTNVQQVLIDYVPVFVVAAYDGYYVATKQVINDVGVPNMVFSPKMPYLQVYTKENGDVELYSYNLSLKEATKISANGSIVKTKDTPLNSEEQLDFINKKITDVLNEYIVKEASVSPRGQIYLPSQVKTIQGTNPVRNTTVFAYLDNFDLGYNGQELQAFGIGGAEIKQNKMVVGFEVTSNGKTEKFYTYSDKLPSFAKPAEVFDSPEDAAQNGYYFYS